MGIHVMDLVFVRVFMNFIFSNFTIRVSGYKPIRDFPSKFKKMLVFRSFLGALAFTTLVFAIKALPLFILTINWNTMPFISAIIGYLVNKEKISKIEILLMTGCFTGVIILALSKGGVFDGDTEVPRRDISVGQYLFGLLMIYLTNLGFAGITVMTRKMKEIHFSILLFYYGMIASTVVGVYLGLEYLVQSVNGTYTPVNSTCTSFRFLCYNSTQWGTLLIIGVLNAASMNFMTIAMQLEDGAFVNSILYIQLVYALIIDLTYFEIKFNVYEIVGAAIILVFNIGSIVYKVKNIDK